MKFFKKKDVNDPIKYLNKKEKNQKFFFASWGESKIKPRTKKIIKRTCLIALPVLTISLGVSLGVIASKNNNKNDITNEIIVNKDVSKRRVYLLSNDNYTVPLTVSLDKKNTIYEEMLDVINLLKVSSKASNEYLHGFINDETTVNSFALDENKNLSIDFSNDFFIEDDFSKHKKVEALTASILQFEDISSISIYINGVLYQDKNSNTHLNKMFTAPSLLENKELVTVFYKRTYSKDNNYLIPVSFYSNKGKSDNITFVNGLFKNLPSNYQLQNLDLYKEISSIQEENEKFNLKVNSSALIDENTVNKDLYELVMLSLDLMQKEEKVSFSIEGETLLVEGIYQEEDQQVSSIYYNEIEL